MSDKANTGSPLNTLRRQCFEGLVGLMNQKGIKAKEIGVSYLIEFADYACQFLDEALVTDPKLVRGVCLKKGWDRFPVRYFLDHALQKRQEERLKLLGLEKFNRWRRQQTPLFRAILTQYLPVIELERRLPGRAHEPLRQLDDLSLKSIKQWARAIAEKFKGDASKYILGNPRSFKIRQDRAWERWKKKHREYLEYRESDDTAGIRRTRLDLWKKKIGSMAPTENELQREFQERIKGCLSSIVKITPKLLQ